MKTSLSLIIAILISAGSTGLAQENPEEYLGLPGDNLNLYAVMKLFQESETLEGFERKLNAEDSRINNLDLNNDNLTDYITVTDFPDGNDHTIVLRVPLGPKDFQDVAVFTVQKFNDGNVQIQLIGDEQLYGKNYIIEPIYEETPNPGYMGRPENRTTVTVIRTTPYEIAYWPVIRYIYLPGYTVWRSSWYWGYYPEWWRPWNPFSWHYYYGYHYYWYDHYYSHYHHWDYCRWNRYNDFYVRSVRIHSPVVEVNITKNVYKTTYSHPEQRRDGEALYRTSYPERATSTSSRRPDAAVSRQNASSRTEAQQAAPQRSVSKSSVTTGSVRSTSPSGTQRSNASTQVRSSSPGQREATTNTSRASSQSQNNAVAAPSRSSSQSQRSSAATTSRSSSASQRSTVTAPSKSSSQTQKSAVAAPSRSSSQNQRSAVSSSSRSSSQRSSAASTSRSSSQGSSATRSSSQSGRSSSSSSSSSSSRSSGSESKSKSERR